MPIMGYIKALMLYTIVIRSQSIQDYAACEQRDRHHEQHTEIEKKGVLRYALVGCRCVRHERFGFEQSSFLYYDVILIEKLTGITCFLYF